MQAALARASHGNVRATASQGKMVRAFDFYFMKESVVQRGHKGSLYVPSSSFRLKTSDLSLTPCHQTTLAWHSVHPILVPAVSPVAIPSASHAMPALSAWAPQVPTHVAPSRAHDSNICAPMLHPLGHLLVSASNDHTARFWARERRGDAPSFLAPVTPSPWPRA
jgi:polyadenylation factor subunit 2